MKQNKIRVGSGYTFQVSFIVFQKRLKTMRRVKRLKTKEKSEKRKANTRVKLSLPQKHNQRTKEDQTGKENQRRGKQN